MKAQKLVSIITPCYNGINTLSRLFESILSQTYSRLEVIFVDDGSTDGTAKKVQEYISRFQEKGIDLVYIYQENKGLGGAIDTGLKHFTGEYFCWPDSDDFLSIDSVQKKVDFLEKNTEFGLVRSDAFVFKETNLIKPIGYVTRKGRILSFFDGTNKDRFKEEDLFEDYLLERNVIFCPGCHLVRTSAFLDVNPSRSIYHGKAGQNYQILLPLIYKYKFGYIDEPLYNYILTNNSLSRSYDTYEKIVNSYDLHALTIVNTLLNMNLSNEEYNHYIHIVKIKYFKRKLIIACKYQLKEEIEIFYNELRDADEIQLKERILYFFLRNASISFFLYKMKSILHPIVTKKII